MIRSFEDEVLESLKLDIEEFRKGYEDSNNEILQAMEDYNELASRALKAKNELKAKYKEHLETPKDIIKANKKEWKAKKKQLNIDIIEKNKLELQYKGKANEYVRALDNNVLEMNNAVNQMADAANRFIKEVEENDWDIIDSLKIATLQTKVKINLKSYAIEKMGRNIRGGMSFGKGFKPRFFLSGSIVNKKQTTLTSDEVFEIRKNDDFSTRVSEIAEFINVINPENLETAILNIMKREKGSQYISEFLD